MSEQSSVVSIRSQEPDRELTLNLVEAVNAVHRTSRRATTARMEGPHRSQPQISLARVVRATPGISVHQAAQQLSLAPNTVSTLVGQLVTDGWLERRPDQRDRRVVRLHLTDEGSRRMEVWRERRADAVASALGEASRRLGHESVQQCVEVLDLVAQLLADTPGDPADVAYAEGA